MSQNEPSNIGASCDDTWLSWGSINPGRLTLRNMLANPTFAQSIQDAAPGSEETDMGGYYPSSAYVGSLGDFQNLGCPPDLSGLKFS